MRRILQFLFQKRLSLRCSSESKADGFAFGIAWAVRNGFAPPPKVLKRAQKVYNSLHVTRSSLNLQTLEV